MAELPEPCLPEPRLLIGGELRGASDGGTFPIENPATGEEAGRARDATDADVQDAIAAARRAFDETSWSTDAGLRAKCLRQLKAALDADFEILRGDHDHRSGRAANVDRRAAAAHASRRPGLPGHAAGRLPVKHRPRRRRRRGQARN